MKTFFLWTLTAILVLGYGCKPAQPSGARGTGAKSKAGAAGLNQQKPAKVDGSGHFSFAEVEGLDLFIVYYAPWTDAGKNIQAFVSGLERGGLWVLPVAVDGRPTEQRKAEAAIPKGRLPAVWADDGLIALAGELRALPTTLHVDAQGKLVKKWQGSVDSALILADRGDPQ